MSAPESNHKSTVLFLVDPTFPLTDITDIPRADNPSFRERALEIRTRVFFVLEVCKLSFLWESLIRSDLLYPRNAYGFSFFLSFYFILIGNTTRGTDDPISVNSSTPRHLGTCPNHVGQFLNALDLGISISGRFRGDTGSIFARFRHVLQSRNLSYTKLGIIILGLYLSY